MNSKAGDTVSQVSDRDRFNEEMARTAFNKKAVSRAPMREVFALATSWFKERGYKALPSGRPNQLYIMGGPEGALPRVNGDILAIEGVGKKKVTMLTFDAVGERLSPCMAEFVAELRAQAKTARCEPTDEESAASK
jgi:hypothetical protein